MRNIRFIALLTLALGLILVVSCSGNSVTQPQFSPDRIVSGNGNGPGGPGDQGEPVGPSGPNGPWGSNGPDPDFEADCIRNFTADFLFDLPCDLELEATGTIEIQDIDCTLDETDVYIFFNVTFADDVHQPFVRVYPGIKTFTDEGILYSGERIKSNNGQYHSFEMVEEFELLTYEVDDLEVAIDGWVHRNRTDVWTNPNCDLEERSREWHVDIAGVEVFD